MSRQGGGNQVNIRKRLVTWHTGILAGLLLIFTIGLYMVLSFHLHFEVDDSLSSWAAHTLESIEGNGQINDKNDHGEPITSNSLVHRFNIMDSFALVFELNGKIVSDHVALSKKSLLYLQRFLKNLSLNKDHTYGTINLDDQPFRIYVKDLGISSGKRRASLVLGRSLMHVRETLSGLIVPLTLAWLIAVFACAFVSWLFVGRTLRPVNMMTREALKIAASEESGRQIKDFGDNDEFGELSSALNRMLASLEASSIIQRKFLADASHELRTPLTSIKANLDFINRAKNAPESEKKLALRDITAEVDRMAKLVNQLLILARVEALTSSVCEKMDLTKIIKEVHAAYQNRKLESNRLLLLKVAAPALYVNADPEKLRQILVILLDNAIKYSPVESEIKVKIWRQDNSAVIEISDCGPGIPESELLLVFNRFYRGSNVKNNTEGSGLGLSIVKSILKNLGGEIELSNRIPNGLAVRITVPLS